VSEDGRANSSYEAQGIHANQPARILGVEGQTGIDLIIGDLAPAVPSFWIRAGIGRLTICTYSYRV
jgi:hypothetical protein